MGSRDSKKLSIDERAQLAAELARPFRSIRQLIYGTCIASGGIGAFVFFFRALAGRDLETTLPSLALQLGVVAAAFSLLRWERKRQASLTDRLREQMRSGAFPGKS
ncbi:MAG: DUF3493 domain-containing protein [Synechococcus sp.]